jgi:hypothetical protein
MRKLGQQVAALQLQTASRRQRPVSCPLPRITTRSWPGRRC